MRRLFAFASCAAAGFSAAACGSGGGGAITQVMESPATAENPDRNAGDVLFTRFRACAEQADCAIDESCVLGVLEPFNICLKPCATVDECRGPDANFPVEDTLAVTCSTLQGADRCVLSCDADDDCPSGMACLQSACVWP